MSNQKRAGNDSLTKNKFMMTATLNRPNNFSTNFNEDSSRRIYDNSSTSLDPRKKVSPRNIGGQGSPGIS